MAFPFLSEEWIVAAREIRTRYEDQTPDIPASVRANLNINEVPFGDGSLQAHLDTSSGRMQMDLGHLDPADATLTMDYATARSFVVDQDQAAIMQAVMAGKVKIQGDLSKLMAMASLGQSSQSAGAGVASEAALLAGRVAREIKDITESTTAPRPDPAPPAAPAQDPAPEPVAPPPSTPSPPEVSTSPTDPASPSPD